MHMCLETVAGGQDLTNSKWDSDDLGDAVKCAANGETLQFRSAWLEATMRPPDRGGTISFNPVHGRTFNPHIYGIWIFGFHSLAWHVCCRLELFWNFSTFTTRSPTESGTSRSGVRATSVSDGMKVRWSPSSMSSSSAAHAFNFFSLHWQGKPTVLISLCCSCIHYRKRT